MRSKSLLLALLIALNQAASFASAPPIPIQGPLPAANAKVIADPMGLDFGIVQPHTVLQGTFRLVNLSDAPRKILQAVPSCQCTTIDIVGKEIPPKGTLEVPVTMKVSSTGSKVSNVKVVIDGEPKPLSLGLKAEVSYPVRVQVPDMNGAMQPFIDAAANPAALSGVATVSSVDGKPFVIRSVQGEPARLVAGQGDAPRASWQVAYTLPGEPCEKVPAYLIVETDRPDARLVDARVRHACTRISPALDIAEFRSNAGVMAPGTGASFELEIKKLGNNRVGSVEALDPRFKASLVSQRSDGSSTLATIRIEPGPEIHGVFLTPLRIVGIDAEGRPLHVRKPGGAPGSGDPTEPRKVPAEAQLLVFGKVE
jgi:hypothetical protein